MKKILVTLVSFIMLTSCGTIDNGSSINQNSGNSALTTDIVDSELEDAKTIFDLKDKLNMTSDWLKYSECDDDDEFLAYFDLLALTDNDYIEVEKDDSKYILFLYRYYGYGAVLENVNGIDKKYSDNTLTLDFNKEISQVENKGCEPDISACIFIIRVDNDFDNLIVDGREYQKYDGGRLRVGDKYGMVDGEFNIRVPVIYDLIMNFPLAEYTLNASSLEDVPLYYRVCGENGSGIVDDNFNTVLSPKYYNITYIGDNKYVVMREKGESSGIENNQIGVIDGNENIIHDFIDGFVDAEFRRNYAHQIIFKRSVGGKVLSGVINEDFEIVIEPKYKDISVWCEENENQFYVVENENEEFAVIDCKGVQQTDFEKTSVYDVQTKYQEKFKTNYYK